MAFFLAIKDCNPNIAMMIPRLIAPEIESLLAHFPAVGLLGPRQVGKTTLARALASQKPNSLYLDLENPDHLHRLDDPVGYLASHQDKLVILDEVQRAPEIFQVLRGLIDERILAGQPAGHFLLLGSASIDLLRQSSETLAGRIIYRELHPLDVREVAEEQAEQLWVRGGFPRSFEAIDDANSAIWRDGFIKTYLERDIPALGARIPAETLRRLWTMLAHNHGGLLNVSNLARALAIDGKTVTRYLDLLVDLLLVRRLPPYHTNVGKRLVKSPKVYLRDSGIVHTLLRLDDREQVLGHSICGASWEGHVLETLIAAAPARSLPSFWRTTAGAEIDLVLELPGGVTWVVEIKRGLAPKISKGFRTALSDLKPARAFIVYSGGERYPKGDGIEAISLRALAQELAGLG